MNSFPSTTFSSHYPTLSWKNSSLDINNTSGIAKFTFPNKNSRCVAHEISINLPDFTSAHNLLDFLNKVTDSARELNKLEFINILESSAETWRNT